MSSIRTLVLAACLIAPTVANALDAEAVDRANAAAAAGPTVLQVHPYNGQFRGRALKDVTPGAEEQIVRAVPVPHVMNGGGFGITGFDYYSDAATEGSLRQRRHVNDYILAPGLRRPLY